MNLKSFKKLIEKYQNGELVNSLKKLMDNWYDSLSGEEDITWSDDELTNLKTKILSQVNQENKPTRIG